MKNRHNYKVLLVTAFAATALILSGCGESGDGGAYIGTPGDPVEVKFSDSDSATPLRTNRTKLGEVIAGQAFRTLYTFQTDDGKPIDCRGECVSTWLPVIVGAAGVSVSGNIDRSKVGAVEFSKQSNQLSYNGRPLYFFADDDGDASVAGAGKESYGAVWFAMTPDGELKEQ